MKTIQEPDQQVIQIPNKGHQCVCENIRTYSLNTAKLFSNISEDSLYSHALNRKQMSILGWIIIGGLAGWVASLMWKGSGSGLIINILLGIAGAIVGGFVFGLMGMTSKGAWGSFVTAVVGAFLLLWIRSFLRHSRK